MRKLELVFPYLTTFGWSYCLSILPSCRNFFFCSSGRVVLQVFTATGRLPGVAGQEAKEKIVVNF